MSQHESGYAVITNSTSANLRDLKQQSCISHLCTCAPSVGWRPQLYVSFTQDGGCLGLCLMLQQLPRQEKDNVAGHTLFCF